MTAIQNDFNKLLETQRAARVDEAERSRHNQAYETEVNRHNLVDERQNWYKVWGDLIFGKKGIAGDVQSANDSMISNIFKILPMLFG